jgi:arginase
MSDSTSTTLRLFFPQWQGGDNPPYHFGAQLLAWLAPEHHGPSEEVNVAWPTEIPLEVEGGIKGRSVLLEQHADARRLIDKHAPDRLVVLGGDCLVDLAPFAYLNERYDGELAVLWVDAHPDVMTPADYANAHAHVLGNLLGEGDEQFAGTVKLPLKPKNVMYAGIKEISASESVFIGRLGLAKAGPTELAETSAPVIEWFKSTGAKHLAIHLDLDVLDPTLFRALLFANPETPGVWDQTPQGSMKINQVVRLLADIAEVADVVGLGIAEHLPWDALALRNMLAKLPLIGSGKRA